MNFLTISGLVVFAVWVYVLFLRPKVLAAFPKIVTIECKLWDGSRQVLMGHVMALGGLVVGVHDYLLQSGADPSTLLNEIANFVPEAYRGLVLAGVLFMSGIALSWLRKTITGPTGSSLPNNQ